MSRKGVESTEPPRTTRMRPACSTTKTRVRSPGIDCRSTGFWKPLATRVVVRLGVPVTGVAEQEVPVLGEGRGEGSSPSSPLQEASAAKASSAIAARRRSLMKTVCREGAKRSGPPRRPGEDPQRAHQQVGEVPEEGRRAVLVGVVADELQDPA